MTPESAGRRTAERGGRGRAGDVLAVGGQSGASIGFFDVATYERLGVLDVPSEPHELLFDPRQRLLYCTITYHSGHYHQNTGRHHQVCVIDPDGRELVEIIDTSPEHAPHGLALDRERGLLYVTVEAGDTSTGGVVVYDTATRKRVRRIDTRASGTHWFALAPDGRRGYAVNKEAPFVSVVDTETGAFLDRIEVPSSEGLAVSPDGRYLYVAAPLADFTAESPRGTGVRVIDTATGQLVRNLPTEGVVTPVHTTAGGLVLAGEARVAEDGGSSPDGQTDGVLNVYAAGTHEPAGRVEVGVFPLTITSSPDGALAYVANALSNSVTVVDLESLRPVGTLEATGPGRPGAHGLAYVPGRAVA
ncbi:surface layer protein [Streptomyces sp. CB02923]|uniref:surface layer protein n=1 Tax=Streptomyces sp. CB02923 TaxID=1718985 RepID=UPI00093AA9C9|nr:surface layer protein [Streptomyces sp. CB02923]OKI09239.1 surface layer protein [Streptomyces sp. CB02923]